MRSSTRPVRSTRPDRARYIHAVALRDLLRLRRRGRRPRVGQHTLSEDDVRRLQRVQRAAPSSVRVLGRDQ